MKNKTILLISPEAWGTNFVSKHHYANYLAKHNTVYFLNPVLGSIVNPFGNVKAEIKPIKDNLFQVNYKNLLPRLNTLPKFIQQFIFKRQAKQIQTALNIMKFDIVWSFDPYRFWNQTVWGTDKTIYHTVDFHPKAKFENEIIKSSKHKISISKFIPSDLITKVENISVVSHGISISNELNKNIKLPGNNILKCIYVGNVSNLLDVDRINRLVEQNNTVDFILIGPTKKSNISNTNVDTTRFNKNIFLLGELSSNLIQSYLSKADICILLLKDRGSIKNINSHKVLEYLYSGNVVLSDGLLDYKGNKIIESVWSKGDFNEKFKEIIQNIDFFNSNELSKKRKDFAIQNSYDNKIEEISTIIYKT